MSSTDVVLSPTKKTKQSKMEQQQQIVSKDVTNGSSDSNSCESVSQPELINSNETNKDCQESDACMEPLLIQDCLIEDDKFVSTNSINETNCVLSDDNSAESPISVCDRITNKKVSNYDGDGDNPSPTPLETDSGGGGFMKTNLSLNLNSEKILSVSDDEKANLPKNKKFLDSDDQIMNQIFFQTITVTPTTEEDMLLSSSRYLGSDATPLTPSEIDSDLIVGPVDFFNRKIEDDDAFDTTYTDTVDNYQEEENDGNLCSLNDNFNDNYCSFSSIDYNTTNIRQSDPTHDADEEREHEKTPENELTLGAYAEQMRQQRPSIVIDCYDSDSKTEEEEEEEEENVVIGDEKINDYCFYFDQTIEEDDDDACYVSDSVNDINLSEHEHEAAAGVEKESAAPIIVSDEDAMAAPEDDTSNENINNGKTHDAQGEGENDIDECLETETESETDDVPNDDDKSASDDEGVINESCMSVNSAVESFESEATVVKKTVKKVKTTKTTSKKSKTISSTTESSSITSSSKAESFETSISNGSVEMIEQQNNVIERHESITNGKELQQHGGVATEESRIEESHQVEANGIEKKKSSSGKKKSKKKKSEEKENISVKSSFSKFDALQKKNLQSLQNGKSGENGVVSPDAEKKCHACDKVVFQMEQIKAEKKFWHRSCFRCAECNKQLNVDTYQSHEGVLYCKPHFKTLFAPKVVEENNEPVKPRKLEMIILENQPIELPPDVVRSSDKADLGLDELSQINLRQRFQVFENAGQQETKVELDKASSVKRSTSILSKLARFQAKGMDVGADDSLNGINYENSSEEEDDSEDDLDDNDEDIELIRAKRAQKEKPMSFKEMHDIKSKFENGQLMTKEERREERKQELQNIRSRLFMGKQAKIKEMYQQAVAESEQTITSSGKKSDIDIGDKAKSIKEKFEKGDIFDENDTLRTLKDEEMAVFEQGIGKQSRSLFLELDATASKNTHLQESPSSAYLNTSTRQTPRQNSQTMIPTDDIVRSDSKVEDVQIETADIVSKFKFFETYKAPEKEKKTFRITPPRDYQGVTKLPSPEVEAYKDPHIARNEKRTDQDEILELQKTASKMLSKFRQMEEHKEERPSGPKPLKRFTPPPESERTRYVNNNEDSGPEYSDEEEEDEEECSEEESEAEEEQDPNYIKSSHKNVDEFLKAAQSAERAKKLREKFEKWEENEIKKEMNNSSVNLYEETQDEGQMETAKSLKARFEQMQKEEPKLPSNRPVKVNRFV